MSKKPEMQIHVQSSAFKELLTTQKDALQTFKSMEEILKQVRLMEFGSLVEEIKLLKEGDDELKVVKETKKVQDKQLKELQKISSKPSGGDGKDRDEEAKAIANLAKSVYTLKTMGDKFGDFGKSIKEKFSPSALKTGLLSKLNVGGIFSKSIDREKFIKQQRAAGSSDSRADLKEKFEGAYKTSRQLQKVGSEFDKNRKEAGLSESEYGKTVKGKELLAKKSQLAEEHGKYDIRAAMVAKADKEDVSPTQKHADAGAQEEQSIEMQKNIDAQTTILTKIEENTRGDSPAQKIKPKDEKSGGKGLLSGLLGDGKIGKALDGMKSFGVGLLAIAGALWVASKAFASFAEVEWESVTKGIVALGALVIAAKVLDTMKGSMVKSAAVLGLMALAVWGISKSFGEFAEIEWDTILKGIAAIAALGVVGVVLGKFAGYAVAGGVALAALGAGLWVVGKGMQEMGEAFNEFVDGIEKLSNIGFEGLAGVAGGMVLVGGALAAFAAGQVAAGLGTLVSNLLTIGQDSPIEQLQKLASIGGDLNSAADGIGRVGEAMSKFAGIDKKSMEAINDFPWVRATAFVAAGGAMSVDGGKVYNASKSNADSSAAASKSGGGNTTVVNAPVNNSSKSTNVMKPQIRNQESSVGSWLRSKFV